MTFIVPWSVSLPNICRPGAFRRPENTTPRNTSSSITGTSTAVESRSTQKEDQEREVSTPPEAGW